MDFSVKNNFAHNILSIFFLIFLSVFVKSLVSLCEILPKTEFRQRCLILPVCMQVVYQLPLESDGESFLFVSNVNFWPPVNNFGLS